LESAGVIYLLYSEGDHDIPEELSENISIRKAPWNQKELAAEIDAEVPYVRKPEKNTVPEILEQMAKTFRERAAIYGPSYMRFGQIAAALWPDGIPSGSYEELNRLGIIVQIIGKLVRYAAVPGGHKDSAHDMAVYAAMLESITEGEK
jgi:hypothetical protein